MVVPGRRLESPGVVAGDRVSGQELRHRLGRRARDAGSAGDGRRRRSCSSSTCGSEERRNSAISTHSGWVFAPITERTGLRMAAACSGPNVHSVRAGSSTPKKVSASLIDCVTTPGIRSSSNARHSSHSRPLAAATNMANAPEWSPLRVCLEHRAGGVQERIAERQRDQRRLQQRERVHLLGVVEGQLGCDRRAGGVARDVGAPHTEVLEQRRGVGGVIGDAHRRRGVRAADPTPLVVADELVAVGQRRLWKERHEAVGDEHVDQQHGLACSAHLVFQFDAVDVYALHGSSSFAAEVGGPQPICVSKAVTAVTLTVTAVGSLDEACERAR